MKKIFFVLAFFVFCFALSAQETKFVEKIKILEVGSALLSNGECAITLDVEIDPETYFVMITPVGNYTEMYIKEKDNKRFVVKSDATSNAEFQYIVIEKRRKEMLNTGNSKSSN